MLWRLPFCQVNRHRADRATVLWNGIRHVGACRDCGKPVRKSSRADHWKLLTPEDAPNSQ